MSGSQRADAGASDEGTSAFRRFGPYLLLVAGALLFGGGLRYHLHFREVPAAGGFVGVGIAWLHGAFGLVPLLLLASLLVGWSASMIQPGRLRFERSWTCAYTVIFVCFAAGLAGVWDAGGTLGQIVGGGVREVVGTAVAIALLGLGSWLSLGLATDRWSFGRARGEEELEEALPTTVGGGVASSPADGMMPTRTGAETAPHLARAHGTTVPTILRTVVAPSEEDVAKTLHPDATGSLHGSEDAALAVLDAPVFEAPVALFEIERLSAPASDDARLGDRAELDPERFIPELIFEAEESAAPEAPAEAAAAALVAESGVAEAAFLGVETASAQSTAEPVIQAAAGDDDDDVDFGDDDDGDDGDDDEEDEEDWDDDDDDDDGDDDEEEEEEDDSKDGEESDGGSWDDSEEADDSGDDDEEEDDDDWDDDDDDEDDDEDDEDEDDDEDDDDEEEDWSDGGDGEEWNASPAGPSRTTELTPAARRGSSPDAPLPAAAGADEEEAGSEVVLRPAARLQDTRPSSISRPAVASAMGPTSLGPASMGPSIVPTEDPRFERAVELVLGCRRAAPSLLQRRMMLDFPTATRFLEAMEQKGWIGPARGGLDREIRVSLEDYRLRRS